MFIFLSIIYVLVCLFLIAVVLLQSGKGGGLGAGFGGGSGTVFGSAGAGNLLTRTTSVCAALFMILSATLAYMSSSSSKGLENAVENAQQRQAARSGRIEDGEDEDGEDNAPVDEPEPGAMSIEGDDAGAGAEDEAVEDTDAAAAADDFDLGMLGRPEGDEPGEAADAEIGPAEHVDAATDGASDAARDAAPDARVRDAAADADARVRPAADAGDGGRARRDAGDAGPRARRDAAAQVDTRHEPPPAAPPATPPAAPPATP